MSLLGLYQPGTSLLHRAPAAVKLLMLLTAGVVSVLLDDPWQVLVFLGIVVAMYGVAGVALRTLAAQLRPLLWLGAATAIFHVAVNGLARAFVVVGLLGALVLLAALVTLTTRTTDLVDTLVAACRPLRVLRVDPARAGLLLALGIRCVPIVVDIGQQVRDAQRARGLEGSARAFVVPLIVRSLRHADALGEALVARGLDDAQPPPRPGSRPNAVHE